MTAAALLPDTGQLGSERARPVAARRLLLVEDNLADSLLTQAYLRDVLPGVEFDTAARLGELTPERADTADCAILDLSLPDASGLEALAALRAMSQELPIIVLTGFDDLELALDALRHGAEDYLIKNHADGYTLERAIRYAVERRRMTLDLAGAMTRTSATLGEPVLGTHEVAVRVDEETGEYALRCMSCDWEPDHGNDAHSWTDRALDTVLPDHIDFGGLGIGAVDPLLRASKPVARQSRLRFVRRRLAVTRSVLLRLGRTSRDAVRPSRVALSGPLSPEAAKRAHPSSG